MPDEVTFDDLISLTKIKPDTTVEKFGGQINSSFYDGANILGTLSQKKLVVLPTGTIGQNPVVVAETGTQLLVEAKMKSEADFDNLDLTILVQIKNGKKKSAEVATAVNVRPLDLAMHLYRLLQQGYITCEFSNGILSLMLTEQGFSQASSGVLPHKQQEELPQAQPVMPAAQTPIPTNPEPLKAQQNGPIPDPKTIIASKVASMEQSTTRTSRAVVVIIVVIIVALLIVALSFGYI